MVSGFVLSSFGLGAGSRWITRGLGVVLIAAIAACAPSLSAVKTTASLGSALSSYEGAFDLAAADCQYVSLGGPPDPQCQALQHDAANWHAVNRALVGYAAALNAMADDSKDTSEQSTVATMLGAGAKIGASWSTALSTSVTTSVSSGVATLIAGITGGYRRERLATTIKASADALQAVAAGLDENIALLDHAEQNLVNVLADTVKSIQIGSAPAADKLGLAIALTAAQSELAAHRATLTGYKAAVDAFAKAHATLLKGLSGLGNKQADLEMGKLIASDVSTIVQNTRTALTPPAAAATH